MTQTLAIIPARGGSKGIPHKNLRLLAGKPLVAHTVTQAIQAQSVDRIVVSTDDSEIAQVARRYGAEVVWRPASISGDTASSESALLYTLEHLDANEDYAPDLLVFLQCTSPLTHSEDIDGTIQALLDEEADSALAVTHFHYFVWKSATQGGAVGINHDKNVRLRRQDRAPQYLETGAVYVMRTPGFIESKHRFFGKTALHVMPAERCLEIDEPVDLEIAEVLLRHREQARRAELLPKPISALVLDFDGVFTDNHVVVREDGLESVRCHRGDGWGLSGLKAMGLPLLVISSEKNPVVAARCDKLGLPYAQAIEDKLTTLTDWTREHGISLESLVYLGNDVNDLACLEAVGCGVVVNDAHPEVVPSAQMVLERRGGQGAIRELADLILGTMKEN